MKKWILILILFISHSVWALAPGDTVYLEGEFRETLTASDSGSAGLPITYQGYGTGAYILGSIDEDVANTWECVNIPNNIWATKDTFAHDVAEVWYNTDSVPTAAVKKQGMTLLLADGDFAYESTVGDRVLFRSDGATTGVNDPDVRFAGIEISYGRTTGSESLMRESIVYLTKSDNITIKDLNIKYFPCHAIATSGTNEGITITGNTIEYGGGRYFDETNTNTLRLGDGIVTWGSASDILIENNTIKQVYDNGITVESGSSILNVSIADVTIDSNNVSYCTGGIAASVQAGTAGAMSGLRIQNNNISYTGAGWSGVGHAMDGQGIKLVNYNFTMGDNLVQHNKISNTVTDGSGDTGDGIWWMGDGFKVNYNTLINIGRIGISCDGISGNNVDGYMIGNIINTTGYRAVKIEDTDFMYVWNNTLYDPNYYGIVLYDTATNVDIRNNIIVNDHSSNDSIYVVDGATNITSDYNDLYNAKGFEVTWNGTNYTTLAAYQAASGQDSHSIAADPLFRNAAGGDFRLMNRQLWRGGTFIDGNYFDIKGKRIPRVRPSIGIYQFNHQVFE